MSAPGLSYVKWSNDRPPLPPPWTVERLPGGFKVIDANGQSLAYFYARENDHDANTAGVLTRGCAHHGRGKADGEQLRQAALAARPRPERRLRSAPFLL